MYTIFTNRTNQKAGLTISAEDQNAMKCLQKKCQAK